MSTKSSHPARTLITSLLTVIALTFAGTCAAGEVVIIRSSDAEPYTQAEAALREQLARHGHSSRAMTAKEASGRGLDHATGHPAAVVAVGTPGARWLHKQVPADVKLTYCMVTGAEEAGLLSGRATGGVTTDVPIGADPAVATSKARPPEEFQIAVNLIVARQLDLDVPDSLSRRATFVYRPER